MEKKSACVETAKEKTKQETPILLVWVIGISLCAFNIS